MHITSDNWETEVMKSAIPVLVDFWAPWCAPCVAIAPILDELADELGDRVKIAKINVDDDPGLAQQLGIRAIPTLLIFKNGIVQEQTTGTMSKANLTAKLQAHID